MEGQRGFTLLEMLVTTAVVVVLGAIGVPAVRGLLQSVRANAASHELTAAFALARIEAVNRGHPVSVCPSLDGRRCRTDLDWSAGWIVYLDAARTADPQEGAQVLDRSDARTPRVAIRATAGRRLVRFQPSGWSSGTNVTLRVCDRQDDRVLISVIVNNAGRARTERPARPTACGLG